VNSSTEFPDSPAPDLQLSQVDPPHPFKSAWKTLAVSAIILILAIAVFVFFIRKPPESTGEILQVNLYPVHSTESGSPGQGMAGDSEPYDQLVILAKVRVHNQTNIPLFLQDISAEVTSADGSKMSSIAAGSQDFDRIFRAFPSLASVRSAPFDRSATINPGDNEEGLAIFSFPFTEQQWSSRKKATIHISFIHQSDLVLTFPR
jgi:hypothetical protein